jgi:hypothetical protein
MPSQFDNVLANDSRFKLGGTSSTTYADQVALEDPAMTVSDAVRSIPVDPFVGPLQDESQYVAYDQGNQRSAIVDELSKMGIPRGIAEQYSDEPPIVPKPKELETPSTGSLVKRQLISMVPFWGEAKEAHRQMIEKQAAESWKQQQTAVTEQWKQEQALIKPVVLDQVKADLAANKQLSQLKRTILFLQQSQNMPYDQAFDKAEEIMGITKNESTTMTPYEIETLAGIMPAVKIGSRFYRPDGKTEFPVDTIMRIHSIAAVKSDNENPYNSQDIEIVDPDNPSGHKMARFDPRLGKVFDIDTGMVIPNAKRYYTSSDSQGAVESWNAPTPWYDEEGKPVVIQSSNRGQIRSVPMPGGAVTKTGLTAATRQLGETARVIIPKFDKTIKLLDNPKIIAELGPIGGRWNEFMAGKIGSTNPEFAALRANIGLLQTGTMRAHVGARGGVALMSKFEGLFNSQRMDAPTLKASLIAVRDFLKGYRDEVYPSEAEPERIPVSGPDGSGSFTIPPEQVDAYLKKNPKARKL